MSDSVLYQGLTLLGFLALGYLVLKHTFKLLMGFRVHILSQWWRKDLRKYGGWAVVTGATDGIGKSYAKELAKMGFNVVLISRTLEKLQNVAAEIEKQSGRKAKIIQADFTGGAEIYPNIEEGLKDLDIGILVNNVGMAHKEPSEFISSDDIGKPAECSGDVLEPAMRYGGCGLKTSRMGDQVLPRPQRPLVARGTNDLREKYPIQTLMCLARRQFGRDLFRDLEQCLVFVDFFSRSLNIDYQPRGVTVQCVMPLLVSTNMTKNVKRNLLVKTSDDFAREALNTAGLTSRTSGCLSHSIQSFLLDLFLTETVMSSTTITWIARHTFRIIMNIRKSD
ncbi:17-beta-hydroxysteroid dehydrogenase type 3-like [Aquarana catesbeiana]|uniref:17-beta-hydroxysteroid dehydrogenase type 3-like n=1 Tax=Aquarana catesbeiana TaxID=8400 RepID=UPI003CC96B7F